MHLRYGTWLDLAIIVVYLGFCVLVGIYYKRRAEKSFEEYFLAGRTIPTVVLTSSIMATFISTVTIVGIPGLAYKIGIAGMIFNSIAMYFLRYGAVFYGPYVRKILPTTIMTLPEMAEYLYNSRTHLASTILSIIFNISRFGTQFLAVGFLLNFLFGISIFWGAAISAFVVLSYTVLSGFIAEAVTDVFQMLFMLIGVGLATILGLMHFGGWGNVMAALPSGHMVWHGKEPLMALVAYAIMAFYMYPDPSFYQRYSAGRSPRQVQFSMSAMILLSSMFGIICCINAMMARALFPDMTPALAIYSFLERFLPPGIFGLWLAAFVAAGMSTGDTYMLIGATNISRDIYKRWIKRDATDAQTIRLTRVLMIFLAAVSTYVVIQFKTVWSIWSWGAMMFASAIFVPLVPGILWRWRKHPDSAWISIASALAIFIPLYPPPGIAPQYVENLARFIGIEPFSPAHQAYIFLAAWFVSTLVYLFVNLGFGKKPLKREVKKPEEPPRESAGQARFYNRNTFLVSVLFWLLAPTAIVASIIGGSIATFLWYFLGGLNVVFGLIIFWQVIRARKELLALK